MGFLLFHTRKLLITQMKENLNMRLMIMNARINKMTEESTELAQKKAQLVTSQLGSLVDSETGEITTEKFAKILSSTTDIDMEIKLCDLKEEEMDAEVTSINSQLKQLDAEEAEIDKALDNSIKKSFGALSGK